jgi:hypothetical protein
MTTIISGLPTCSSSISTLSIRQVFPIMLLTASVILLWLHSPFCSIPVDMKNLVGANFINKICTSPPPNSSWLNVQLSSIFTLRTDSYATWAIFLFLQASVQRLFGNPTTVRWQENLAWRKLWTFFINIFIGQKFDRTSASISYLALPVPFPSQPSRSKSYTPIFLF